jgi:preprotein translocase subunit YajC
MIFYLTYIILNKGRNNMSFIPLLLDAATTGAAQADATGAAGGFGGLGMMIPLIFIVIIMYFFMIRPQNKKQKETEKMISALKKGDKVITIGGIHGTVAATKEQTVVIKVDDNSKIEFNRTAIATVVVDKPADAQPAVEKKGFHLFGKKTNKDKIADEIKDKDTSEDESGAKKDE